MMSMVERGVELPIDIKLEPIAKYYTVIRKKCPFCKADFKFLLDGNQIREVQGAERDSEEKTVKCKVCHSKSKYEVVETEPH